MTSQDNFICPITQTIMADPVICDDGITYERAAITHWLQSHNTSPVTRQFINSTHLIPNIALRNTIQDFLKNKSHRSQNTSTSISTSIQNTQHTQNTVNFNSSQSSCYFENNYYSFVTLNFQNTSKKSNIIVAVVDTSGSMGENADIPGSESSGLSRLDLVKHTLNTITNSLSDNDKLCIVKFSNTAQVISDFVNLNKYGKDITSENIKRLQPDAMTNLWAGIKLGIDKIASIYNDDYNVSMIVMTDGVSNSDPPRGIIPTLQDQIKSKKLNFSINTFGYGYNIDSNLLNQIATIGNGIFGFIPDATMVGTTFVNIISSILTGCVNNLEVISTTDEIDMITPNSFGMISTNQPVHIVIKRKNPFNSNIIAKFNGLKKEFQCISSQTPPDKMQIEQITRLELVKTINQTIINKNTRDLISLQNRLITLNTQFNSSIIKDYIDDIHFDDPNKGQLTKAVSKPNWFEQWGNHYLKAICRAHSLERCITFKEASPQHYISDEFTTQQSRIEQIFCDLPAPEPSNNRYDYSYNSSHTTTTPVVMSNYYVQSGGCFDGYGLVKMYDILNQEIYYKPVHQIQKGDTVYCPVNNNKYASIICVVKLKVNKEISMCEFNEMLITPYHPMYVEKEWIFPHHLCEPSLYEIDYMYDFVLDSGHIIEINNNKVITLGHGFKFNDIVQHEYFGDKIIDDLMNHPDWECGYIQLDEYTFVRGNAMCINKLLF